MAGSERVVDAKPGSRIIEPRRRIHPQLSPARSAADDLAGAGVSSPLPAGDHAERDERARRRLVSRSESPGDRRRRPRWRVARCLPSRSWRRPLQPPRPANVTAYVDAGAGQTLMERPPAKGSIVRHRRQGRRSPSGRCRTAPQSVLLPTTLKADQILFRGQRARRDVARERRRLLRCAFRRRRDTGGRRRQVLRRRPRQAARGEGARGAAFHQRRSARACAAAARRATSRRCSS